MRSSTGFHVFGEFFISDNVWLRLLRDESGSELIEYALVFTLFAVAGLAAMQILSVTANSSVESDETNFGNSLVNGY